MHFTAWFCPLFPVHPPTSLSPSKHISLPWVWSGCLLQATVPPLQQLLSLSPAWASGVTVQRRWFLPPETPRCASRGGWSPAVPSRLSSEVNVDSKASSSSPRAGRGHLEARWPPIMGLLTPGGQGRHPRPFTPLGVISREMRLRPGAHPPVLPKGQGRPPGRSTSLVWEGLSHRSPARACQGAREERGWTRCVVRPSLRPQEPLGPRDLLNDIGETELITFLQIRGGKKPKTKQLAVRRPWSPTLGKRGDVPPPRSAVLETGVPRAFNGFLLGDKSAWGLALRKLNIEGTPPKPSEQKLPHPGVSV